MLLFRGAPALSSFRIERLLTAQRRVAPALCGIRVDYLHFVDLRRDLTPAETAVLERLLDFDRDHASLDGPGQLMLTVPRPGTISPWSSKASFAFSCNGDFPS